MQVLTVAHRLALKENTVICAWPYEFGLRRILA